LEQLVVVMTSGQRHRSGNWNGEATGDRPPPLQLNGLGNCSVGQDQPGPTCRDESHMGPKLSCLARGVLCTRDGRNEMKRRNACSRPW
jgi:hypothetical protein